MARRWDGVAHRWVDCEPLGPWPSPGASLPCAYEVPPADLVRLQSEHTKRMEGVNTLTAEVRKEDRNAGDSVLINERGGKQSHVPERYDLVDPDALRVMAGILGTGAAKYGTENWRLIELNDHVNHAIAHLYEVLRLDRLGWLGLEDDLGNALCRVMFAVAMREERKRG